MLELSRVNQSSEMLEFIDTAAKISVAMVQLADIQVRGCQVDDLNAAVDKAILDGQVDVLKHSQQLRSLSAQRDLAEYRGLLVLKLLFERAIALLDKLIAMAKPNVPN